METMVGAWKQGVQLSSQRLITVQRQDPKMSSGQTTQIKRQVQNLPKISSGQTSQNLFATFNGFQLYRGPEPLEETQNRSLSSI
jgi:hypothetical protein